MALDKIASSQHPDGEIPANLAAMVEIPGTGAIPRTLDSKAQEVVTPFDFGAVDDKTVDSTTPIQNFLTYIAQNPTVVSVCAGSFGITSPLTFDAGSNMNYLNTTRVSYWNAIFWDISSTGLDQLITFQNCTMHRFVGQIAGYGVGGSNYSSRKTRDIFVFGQHMSYANFDKIRANYARRWGLNIKNHNTEMHIEYVQCAYCGTARSDGVNYPLTVSAISNSGSPSHINQLSALTISKALPSQVTTADGFLLVHDTDALEGQRWRLHTIQTILDSTHISVYPWFNPAKDVGRTCYLVWGGGADFIGSDTAMCDVSYLDTLGCGIGVWNQSLYPPRIGSFTAQSCGVATMLGLARNAAMEGGVIGQMYAEGNGLDVVQLTESERITYTIQSYTGQDLAAATNVDYKFWVVTAADSSYDYTRAPRASFVVGSQYGKTGKIVPVGGNVFQDQYASLTPHLDNTMPMLVKHRDHAGISLHSNYNRAKLTGKTGYLLLARGTGKAGQPTGTWTFTPADPKWSINGGAAGANYTVSNFVRPTLFVVYADYRARAWLVQKATTDQISFTGSGIKSPQPIASGTQFSGSFAAPGLELGDIFVGAGASIDLKGLNLSAYCSAAGTLTYVYANLTDVPGVLPVHNSTFIFQKP